MQTPSQTPPDVPLPDLGHSAPGGPPGANPLLTASDPAARTAPDPTTAGNRPLANLGYGERVDFMVELATRLHRYGTTAQRLEAALLDVAARLRVECEPWSSPTALILSFSDPQRVTGSSDITRVVRLSPGDTDLHRLAETDRVAEALIAGELDVAAAFDALRALDRPPTLRNRVVELVGAGLICAALAALLRLPWLEIGVAGFNGLMIGVLLQGAMTRPWLRDASDALLAMFATLVAVVVASLVAPINQNTVIIASLIPLLPGLTLTNSVNELTSGHLVSGTSRFAGAVTTVAKLAVGTAIALYVANIVGLEPQVRAWRPQPDWVEWSALAAAALAFAVAFRAEVRDYPVVMLAAAAGYLVSRHADLAWGAPVGIFLAAMLMTAAGNGYAQLTGRPGAIVRVPGIILLVPGSASLRGLLTLLQQQDVNVGEEAMLGVMNILLALLAGLLLGNLLLPSRRHL